MTTRKMITELCSRLAALMPRMFSNKVTRQFLPRATTSMDFEVPQQAGSIDLMRAIDKFDRAQGYSSPPPRPGGSSRASAAPSATR